ncbi:MAG: hypothetical protein KAJ14_00140, partial [Candidatus Omnitrophica bacterium]|nr:hypothetical protein [Candidatus Omnitrophota bacterium]
MVKIRILRIRKQELEPQENTELVIPDTGVDDLTRKISVEVVRKKIVRIGNGFTTLIRKITSTPDGMKSEVEEPLLISQSGHKIEASQIKGRCEICGGYDSYIFNCFVHGCKRALCLKHVYFFQEGDKQIPLCLTHYKQFVNNRNTW